MMPSSSSYQHSRPAVWNLEDTTPVVVERSHARRPLISWKMAVLLGCLFVGALGVLNQGSETPPSYLMAANLAESAKEGEYDWQKCKDSDDPDCWKKEGERVGGYWENFGKKMRSFWSGFGQRMHDMWSHKTTEEESTGGSNTTTVAEPEEVPAAAEKAQNTTAAVTTTTDEATHHRHHHHSSSSSSVIVPAT